MRPLILLFILGCCSIGCLAQGELIGIPKKEKKKKKSKDEFAAKFHLIPEANFLDGGALVNVPTFYMHETEVSNLDYLWVMHEVKVAGDTALYRALMPDTTVWLDLLGYGDPYVNHYFRYPGFRTYPVVGITYEQATKYCQWLTRWYNAQPDRQFDQVVIELPDETQWELAARAGRDNTRFPWGTPYVRDEKGNWLANFNAIDESTVKWDSLDGRAVLVGIGTFSGAGDGAMITNYIYEYRANDYGLYNMSGNVSEMVRNSIQIPSANSNVWDLKKEEAWFSKGGSFADPGFYMQISSRQFYPKAKAAATRGFRLSLRVITPNKKI